jgi:PAS domain S-box-containing protein
MINNFTNHKLNLQTDLDRILLFITTSFQIDDAFISLNDQNKHQIDSKIGLEALTDPFQISYFKNLIENDTQKLLYNSSVGQTIEIEKNDQTFMFFGGFPIIDHTSEIVLGSICILDKKNKELSNSEQQIINYAILQIRSFLLLYNENYRLQKVIDRNEDRFQIFLKNSKEIFYHLDLKGNFIYVAESFQYLLGHKIDDILGTNFNPLIHPDDVLNCNEFLQNLLLDQNALTEISYRIITQNDSYVWQTSSVSIVKNEGITYFSGVGKDITASVEDKIILTKQKNLYEKILDGLPTAVAVYDSKFRYQYVNPAAIKNEELRIFAIGKTNLEYENYAGRDKLFAHERQLKFEEAISKKQTISWDDSIINKNGTIVHHTRSISPIFGNDGLLELLIGFGVDVTEIKKNQQEIENNRQLISSILHNVAAGILVQGPDSQIIEHNVAACKMLGLTEDQLRGETSFDKHWKVIHENGTEFKAMDHPVPRAIKELKPINSILMGVHRPISNDLVWLLVDAIPVFNINNKLQYVICSFIDITEQKQAEHLMRLSNERFEYSSKATCDVIYDWDIKLGKILCADSYTEQFGHPVENKIMNVKEFINLIHPEDRTNYLEILALIIVGFEEKCEQEYRYLKADNSYAVIKDKAVIIRDNKAEPIRVIGAMQNITSEKNLRAKLEQSESQFRAAFNNTKVGMAILNINGNWIEVNKSLSQILGYTKEELTLLTFDEITHPSDLKVDWEFHNRLITGELNNFTLTKRYFHKNRSTVWADIFVAVVKDHNDIIMHFVAQIIDITERKKLEKKNISLQLQNDKNKALQLAQATNLYRVLADNMIDLVCIHDLNGKFEYVSPSIRHILGYQVEEVAGFSPLDFIHPDDAVEFQKKLANFVKGNLLDSVKLRFKNKNEKYIWCEIKGTLIKENNVLKSFHTSTRNITESIEAELLTKEALRQQRELNELRTNLVSTISHEFRTPMTTIRSSAELIQMYLEDQELKNSALIDKRINTISAEIDRIVKLMNGVLVISKNDLGKTEFKPTNFDLKKTCYDAIELSDYSQKEDRKITTDFKDESYPIFADKNLMEYILLNLLNNAHKYSPGSYAPAHIILSSDKEYVTIKIIDHGIGIPIEDQPKLFNTFFRASNTYGIEGTGLGLYIVKLFTERNLGTIKLESKLGKGTMVTLQFPINNN